MSQGAKRQPAAEAVDAEPSLAGSVKRQRTVSATTTTTDEEQKEQRKEEESKHPDPLPVMVAQPQYDISLARARLREETRWWSNEVARLLVTPQVWLRKHRRATQVFPPQDLVLETLMLCPDPAKVRVVIVAQDPYINPGEACGLAFSVPEDHHLRHLPGSLQHILEEANRKSPCLRDWAKQGVLLLNTILTVDAGGPSLSHKDIGWQNVTRYVLKTVALDANKEKPPICLAWGGAASDLLGSVQNETGVAWPVLASTHPSPLAYKNKKSRLPPFFQCGHFEKVNHILVPRGDAPINWR